MNYRRVIPRDLFNEAKLLKSLGQLALLIHEGRGIRWPLRIEHDGQPFSIGLDEENNGLYCEDLNLFCGDEPIALRTNYNAKSPYPLVYTIAGEEEFVFSDDGQLSPDFAAALDRICVPQ